MEFQHPTVSQIIGQIKNLLEGQFRNISFVGEVTNLSSSATGHWYFTLSDSEAQMSAALFKMDAFRNPVIKNLKDGDKVLVSGGVGVYAKRGTFQVIVKRITPVGKGDLKEQFEKLKRKLQAEGLFDIEVKKPIPQFPRRVAVITAQKGAALQDFLNIVQRRSLWMDVTLVPALVQGDTAPASIRHALEKAIRFSMEEMKKKSGKHYDVIVLTRGGGSLEDLWAFNDEALAWDIYNCPIPIISAVGHQVDYSISDFVSDLRLETPSAAAETLTNSQMQIKERMDNAKRHLEQFSTSLIHKNQNKLFRMNPHSLLEKLYSKHRSYQRRLEQCNLKHRMYELTSLHDYTMELEEINQRLLTQISKIDEKKQRVDKLGELLRVLDPSNVLERGYSYAEDENGHVVSDKDSFEKLKEESSLLLHFHDGKGKVIKRSES